MAEQQQGGIYDPSSGRVLTIEEAQAALKGGQNTLLAKPSGIDQFGPQGEPMSGQEGIHAILKAVPQLAGLLASFTPQGRGLGMAFGVPSLVDMITQAADKGIGNVDPMQSVVQGGLGVGGKWTGDALAGGGKWLANQGGEKVVKALSLPPDTTDQGIQMLRKLALGEKAQLTEASEAAIRAKANATASGGLGELADAMGNARRADTLAPSRMTFWPQEAAANFARRAPRQMAMGQGLHSAGSAIEKAGTPAEIAARLMAAILASAGGGAPEGEAVPSGPRRRGGQ